MSEDLLKFLEKETDRLEKKIQDEMSELLDLPVNQDIKQIEIKARIKLLREEKEHFDQSLVKAKTEAPIEVSPKLTPAVHQKKSFCTQCGAELNSGSKFCVACGTPTVTVAPKSENTQCVTNEEPVVDILSRFKEASKSNSNKATEAKTQLHVAPKNPVGNLTPKEGKDGWGYVDSKDNWIIEPVFDKVEPFYNENQYTFAKKGNRYGIIDRKGNWIIEPIFESAYYDYEEDENENEIINPDTFGLWNLAGTLSFFSFSDENWLKKAKEHAQEEPEEGWENYENNKDEEEESKEESDLDDENNWEVEKKNGKYGMIDDAGKWRIAPKYDKLTYFSEGLCGFVKSGKVGFIDRDDNVVIKPIYDDASCFYEGRCEVELDGESFEIDKAGDRI